MARNAQLMQFSYRTKRHPVTPSNEPPADPFFYAMELIQGGASTLVKGRTAYDGVLPAHDNTVSFDAQPELTAGATYTLRVYFMSPAPADDSLLIEWDDFALAMRPSTIIPPVPVDSPWMLLAAMAGLLGLGLRRMRRQ